jgi:hypothetical protein
VNIAKACSAVLATLACTVMPSFAHPVANPGLPNHGNPFLTPIICDLDGESFDDASFGFINNHGKIAYSFAIDDLTGFGDVGVGALIDNVQGTGFNSMVVTLDGFNPAFSLGPIIYLQYVVEPSGDTCFFAGSLAELGAPRPVARQAPGTYKFTFTPANMISICELFNGNLPFVPTGSTIVELAIGTVTPGNSFVIDAVVVNNKNVLITPHAVATDCTVFEDISVGAASAK